MYVFIAKKCISDAEVTSHRQDTIIEKVTKRSAAACQLNKVAEQSNTNKQQQQGLYLKHPSIATKGLSIRRTIIS